MEGRGTWNFPPAAAFAARLVERVARDGLAPDVLLNVNVPAAPDGAIAGVRITRLGVRKYADELITRTDPFGRKYYWIAGEPLPGEAEEDTDVWAIAHKYISVTPIHMDLTNHRLIEVLQGWDLRV
jgi:5'-nucleotidase